MSDTKLKKATVYGLLVFMVLVWGFNFSFIKWTISRIPSLPFNILRLTFASLLILGVVTYKEGWETMPFQDVVKMGLLGLLGHSVYQIFFIRGLSLTRAGNSSLLIATTPIWTALIAAALKKDEVSKKAWLGIVLAFSGVFLVTLGSGEEISFGASRTTGDLLTLMAALSLSLYTVLSKDLLERYSPLKLTAVTLSIGSLALWFFAGRRVLAQNWASLSFVSWGVLIYSAVFAIVVGYLVWFTAVKIVGPAKASVFNNMTPIVAFGAAFVLLGEPVGWLQLLGGAVVISGVVITALY